METELRLLREVIEKLVVLIEEDKEIVTDPFGRGPARTFPGRNERR